MMMLLELVLVVTVSLVHCQEPLSVSTEKPLKRCRRPLCEVYCPLGSQVDENGCETCVCKMPKENTTPLPVLPCAEPMCANDCREFGGYKRNEHGCMTCECQERITCEDIECGADQFCHPDMSHCRHGMKEQECIPRPVCVDMDQMPGAPPAGCAMMKCAAMMCPYGLRRDEAGCPTCDCAGDPCESHECHVGQTCQLDPLPGCEGVKCPVLAKCTFKSLCHHHEHFHDLLLRGEPLPEDMASWDLVGGPLGYSPLCQEDGTFYPKQCNKDPELPECWCVNDLGLEMHGSRQLIDDLIPGCERNHTESLEVKFQIWHEFNDITPHLEDLKKIVKQHLSHWLTVEEEFIVVVKVEPVRMESRVQIHVLVMQDGETDLPSAAFYMHDQMRKKHCNIHFKGQTMRSDPDTLQVTPRYKQGEVRLPSPDYHQEEHDEESLGTMIIVGCAGGAFVLFLLAALLIVLARRNAASRQFQHKKFANYEKNVSMAGDIGMTHPDDKEKQPPVAIISVSETQPEKASVA